MARETTTNVPRPADAQWCAITLKVSATLGGRAVLTIANDSAIGDPPSERGSGLMGPRESLEALDGTSRTEFVPCDGRGALAEGDGMTSESVTGHDASADESSQQRLADALRYAGVATMAAQLGLEEDLRVLAGLSVRLSAGEGTQEERGDPNAFEPREPIVPGKVIM
ncbi:hypothetical protein [Streptomyces sp. NPDC049916]|uniref:hypothetical protein n=1 Tax=Streptomyces sp. NPDC049916 TaxID=3155156 RepID=UPI0034458473